VDKGDLDQVNVFPLPAQERIIEAFGRLGFRFKGADCERGHIRGVQQTLPFYQEIEYFAAPQYAHTVREVELTFVTSQQGVDVILECDKRGGLFTPGQDTFGRYTVSHADVDRVDWAQVVDGWLQDTVNRYGSMRPHGYAPQGYGQGYGHGHGHGGHSRGMGMGGVVAGAALGVAGGMIAGEMLDDAFEGDDGGDFEE
jgi:sporulation-control protein